MVCGRRKLGYLIGETKAHDPNYSMWIMDNSIVMAWPINLMDTKISQTYLFLSMTKAIWDTTKRNCSHLGNAAQIFELKSRVKEMKQGTMDVTQYYNYIQTIWQELDLFYESELGCKACSVKYKKMIEKKRVFVLLVGLNKELNSGAN